MKALTKKRVGVILGTGTIYRGDKMKFMRYIAKSCIALLALNFGNVSVKATDFPLVDETVTLEYFVGKGAQNSQIDWNDFEFWKKYETLTNVHIQWDQVSPESKTEARNLAIVTGDLPDVFYSAEFSNTDIYRYGQQNVFIALNDLIDQYAPNLKAIMQKYPEVEKAMTFPDGSIYSMPYIFDHDFVSVRTGAMPWVNKEILEKTGLTSPTTTEEFYHMLTKIKEIAPDKIPFSAPNMNMIVRNLAGSFGVARNGFANIGVELDEDGQMTFYPTTSKYKELLRYLNTLYSEGLIDTSIYSTDWSQFMANRQEDKYASYIFWGVGYAEEEEFAKEWTWMTAFEGPQGDRLYVDYAPMVTGLGNYLITSDNPYPEVAVQWLDYFYSKEGARLLYLGEEGVHYEIVNGQARYYPEVSEKAVDYLPWLGNNQGLMVAENSEISQPTLLGAQEMAQYTPELIWSAFTFTDEENDFLAGRGLDISKYVSEMQDMFITGQRSFDEWQEYVETLERMQVEEYVAIHQAAYNRTYGN